MHENVLNNLRKWDEEHKWLKDGDEWAGQSKKCGVTYEEWKASLVDNLIAPNVGPVSTALEIAPGHGRWTQHLLARCKRVIAVDLSPSCLAYCRKRFVAAPLDLFLTDGTTLPGLATGQIDFVWSYDSFVHMHRDVIESYLKEIARVLKPGGSAIVHHSHSDDIGNHMQDGHPGWRSAMSAPVFRSLAELANLQVVDQTIFWDKARKIGVPRFGDRISTLKKKA